MAEATKNCDIEWCKEIPVSWDYKPNKYVMRKIKDVCTRYSGEDILSLTMQGVIIRDLNAGGKMPTTFDGYQKVYAGNLLMCLFDYDVTPRCIGLIRNNGLTSPAYSQFVLNDGYSARYYYYYYLMIDHTKELLHLAKNLRHSFTEDQIGALNVPVPPIDEQRRIADFLDEKCAEIDRLSEDIQKQIDILEEYKKSVITRAVTKGLNPNAEMKDSGQSYIGSIPEKWEIIRIKDVFKMQSGFTPDSKRTDYYDDIDGFNWVTIADINKNGLLPEITKNKISKKYIEAFHPRIAKAGSLLYSFKLSLGQVALAKKDIYTNEAIISFSCKEARNLRFLKYSSSLIEYNANTNIYGSKILNQQLIGNAHVTFPPVEEQEAIANFLDDFNAKMCNIIEEKSDQLQKIDAYKKSIIYEYVTGKKRVA